MDYASQWSHQGINGVVGNKKSILGLESSTSTAVVPCSSLSKETTQTLEKKGSSSSSTVKGQKGSIQHQGPAEANLNCPRCQSTNTKFCYYNNYSLSQPRYYCKACRRYWTQGGSLRNVPVGGGSRKNSKRSSSTLSSKKDMTMLYSQRPDNMNRPVFQSNPPNPSPIQGGHNLNLAYDTSMLPMLPPINPRFITSSELTLGNFMALNPPPGTVGDVYPTGRSFSSSFQGLKPSLHYFTLGSANNNNNNAFGSGMIDGDDNKCKDQKDDDGIHHQEASGGDGGGLIYDNEQNNGGGQGDQSSAGSDGYNNNWNMFGGGEGGSSYSSWQL